MLVLARLRIRTGGQAVVQEILLGAPDISPGGRQLLLGRAQLGADPFQLLLRERLVGHQALGAPRRGLRVAQSGLGVPPPRRCREVLGPDVVEPVAENPRQHRAGLHPVSRLHQHLGDDAVHDRAQAGGTPLVEAHDPDGVERVGPGHLPHRGGRDAGGFTARAGHGDDPGRGIGGGRGFGRLLGRAAAGEPEEEDRKQGADHGRGASPSARRAAMAAATAST